MLSSRAFTDESIIGMLILYYTNLTESVPITTQMVSTSSTSTAASPLTTTPASQTFVPTQSSPTTTDFSMAASVTKGI